MTLQTKNIHSDAYLVAIALIAASLPLSKFAMSVGEFMLLGLWLLSGFRFGIAKRFFKSKNFFTGFSYFTGYVLRLIYNNLTDKFQLFFRNRAAVVLASIWGLHLLGLFNTIDFHYAFKDLRIKLPLLFFPIVFATIPKVSFPAFRKILFFYLAAVFSGTIIGFAIYISGDYYDIRQMSPFISSIRFGLNITFAFFASSWFALKDKNTGTTFKFIFLFLALWLLYFLVLMESITSLTAILLIALGFLIRYILVSKHKFLKVVFLILLIAIPASLTFYVVHTVKNATTAPPLRPDTLDKYTAQGNPYIFDTVPPMIEDGKYVGTYICYKEMKEEWNKRSHYDFDANGSTGQQIKTTLIRYLTSKNLRKDAEGVKQLTDKDIRLIENGVANYNYIAHPGLHTRILKIIKGYETYQSTGDPSGSSIMQRLEYLKASFNLIKRNFWLGVGTGDLQDAFYNEFDRMHSKLKEEFRFHAHNQFVAVFVALGLFGFLYFVFALVYPVIIARGYKDYFFMVFYTMMMISMFSDDTLETQAGATLFGFFTSFLLLAKEPDHFS